MSALRVNRGDDDRRGDQRRRQVGGSADAGHHSLYFPRDGERVQLACERSFCGVSREHKVNVVEAMRLDERRRLDERPLAPARARRAGLNTIFSCAAAPQACRTLATRSRLALSGACFPRSNPGRTTLSRIRTSGKTAAAPAPIFRRRDHEIAFGGGGLETCPRRRAAGSPPNEVISGRFAVRHALTAVHAAQRERASTRSTRSEAIIRARRCRLRSWRADSWSPPETEGANAA